MVTLDYAPRKEFDNGRFVARYLQVLAWISIASMLAAPIFFDSFYLDLTFVFLFWGASALKRHSSRGRKWVLWISGLYMAIGVIGLLYAAVFGTVGMSISIGHRHIEHPAFWQLLIVAAPLLAIPAVPFLVLRTATARQQFETRAGGSNASSKQQPEIASWLKQ